MSMNKLYKITGEIVPLDDDILVTDMETGVHVLASGLILGDDNGKSRGIRPRWCKVFRIGKNVTDVKEGEWILMEHGRWTYRQVVEIEIDGETREIHLQKIDPEAIMVVTDEKPENDMFAQVSKAIEIASKQ